MLKILVCVKQVPDVDLVTMDPETGNLVREGVPTLTNPLDLNALEAAVQVKERYGGEITLITMGPPMAESTLREGLAVGDPDLRTSLRRSRYSVHKLPDPDGGKHEGQIRSYLLRKRVSGRGHRTDGFPAGRTF